MRSSGISTSRLKSYGAVIFSGDFCFCSFRSTVARALLCFFRAKQRKYESTGAMMMKTKKKRLKVFKSIIEPRRWRGLCVYGPTHATNTSSTSPVQLVRPPFPPSSNTLNKFGNKLPHSLLKVMVSETKLLLKVSSKMTKTSIITSDTTTFNDIIVR